MYACPLSSVRRRLLFPSHLTCHVIVPLTRHVMLSGHALKLKSEERWYGCTGLHTSIDSWCLLPCDKHPLSMHPYPTYLTRAPAPAASCCFYQPLCDNLYLHNKSKERQDQESSMAVNQHQQSIIEGRNQIKYTENLHEPILIKSIPTHAIK